MKIKDELQRFLFEQFPVRGELVHLEQSYQEIIHQHGYPPLIQKLLGEALVASCLLASIIKFKGRLTVQFRGKGQLKLLVAQSNDKFEIRGLAQWDGDLTEQDLLKSFKNGQLAIIMDPAIPGGKRWQGIVAWEGTSLAKSLENYFIQSEQLATRIWLAVDDKDAAGLLLQMMPNDKTDDVIKNWEHITHLTNTVSSAELTELPHETLLNRLYPEQDKRIFSPVPVRFQCDCSVAKGENAILLLGPKEAEEELTTNKNIVVTCEFCNKAYIFDRMHVARIFKTDKGSSQLH